MKLTKFPIQMATTPTRVPSGPPRSTSHGPFAVSSIVTEEIARSCCSPMRVCAAAHTSPLPISITKPLRTSYPGGRIAKAWTSLPENKRWCERCPRREHPARRRGEDAVYLEGVHAPSNAAVVEKARGILSRACTTANPFRATRPPILRRKGRDHRQIERGTLFCGHWTTAMSDEARRFWCGDQAVQ